MQVKDSWASCLVQLKEKEEEKNLSLETQEEEKSNFSRNEVTLKKKKLRDEKSPKKMKNLLTGQIMKTTAADKSASAPINKSVSLIVNHSMGWVS